MRIIKYNSQRNNTIIAGINGSSQCFATVVWMLLGFYCPNVNAEDDNGLAEYIKDITANGSAHEYEWVAHQAEIQKYINNAGKNYTATLGIDLNTGKGLMSPEQLRLLLAVGPVIIGTKKMAGLPGGHIILAVDFIENGDIVCNDPYGNALTRFKDQNGQGVIYPVSMFDKEYQEGPIRGMWLQ
jgi:hypothetical protein